MTTRRSFLKSLPLSGYGLALDAAAASKPEGNAEILAGTFISFSSAG
jgi:hypothetical protein